MTVDRDSLAKRLAEDIRRLDALKTLKARSEGELANIEADLERTRADAKARFGTDDPDQLEKESDHIMQQAESQVKIFGEQIDSVYAELSDMGITPGG